MSPNQRDIVEVYFDFPDGRSGPHMVIILSSKRQLIRKMHLLVL
jgi:hypothetical protein